MKTTRWMHAPEWACFLKLFEGQIMVAPETKAGNVDADQSCDLDTRSIETEEEAILIREYEVRLNKLDNWIHEGECPTCHREALMCRCKCDAQEAM